MEIVVIFGFLFFLFWAGCFHDYHLKKSKGIKKIIAQFGSVIFGIPLIVGALSLIVGMLYFIFIALAWIGAQFLNKVSEMR